MNSQLHALTKSLSELVEFDSAWRQASHAASNSVNQRALKSVSSSVAKSLQISEEISGNFVKINELFDKVGTSKASNIDSKVQFFYIYFQYCNSDTFPLSLGERFFKSCIGELSEGGKGWYYFRASATRG